MKSGTKRQWEVTRIVKEKYWVEARTRQEAKDLAESPFSVEVIKETAKVRHERGER